MGTNKKYWKGLDELNETPEFVESTKSEFPQELSVDQFLEEDKLKESSTGRRDFLKFLGFSVAAATVAACEAPVIKAVPYVVKPEDVTPGIANWYASSYYDGDTYASIMVKTREGRPIHIKGNKSNGITKGGTNARIIGSVLSLYDQARLQEPSMGGEAITWAELDKQVKAKLKSVANSGKKVVVLSNTIISPSTLTAMDEWKRNLTGAPAPSMANEEGATDGMEADAMEAAPAPSNVEHVQYDAISYSGMREANKESFGKRMIPNYDFSKAKTIVSVGADFLNSWLLPTKFLPEYSETRNPDGDWMSRHHQFESNMSMTGSNADKRTKIKPSQQGKVLAALYKEVSGKSVAGVDTASLGEEILAGVKLAAADLKKSKGESIVVAGSNRKSVQVIANAINSALKNYSKTINVNDEINLHQSEDDKMASLVKDMNAEKVGALIIWNANPMYSYKDAEGFATGLAKVGFTVAMSQYADETASKCGVMAPISHPLEQWDDFNPTVSHYSLAQPTIRPLHNTRPAAESFMVWAGLASHEGKDSKTYYDYIREIWKQWGFTGQTKHLDFHSYWSEMVHNSCSEGGEASPSSVSFSGNLNAAGKEEAKITTGEWEISFYQKAGIGSGIHANNPWLQELPDPVTKVTWDNYATMSPADMDAKGFNKGVGQREEQNVVEVSVDGKSVKLPVYPQPGQMSGTIGIALGYGRGEGGENIGKSAFQQNGIYGEASKETIGANAFKLAGKATEATNASLSDTGERYTLACTQTHSTVMARNSIMKETTLSIYKSKDASAYNHRHTLHTGWNHEEKLTEEFDLWEEHPVKDVGHRWGLSIDLNLCVGCGSCVVACGSENNVPVVGRDEVRRGREMHWLRLDRYYASEDEATVGTRNPEDFEEHGFDGLKKPADNPKVAFMPLMCHHCNHAPCETVCPVAATTHSNEGLNQMTYNRCIGTRYCGNNCPYKVRRFNWFNYPSYRKFTEVNPAQDDLGRMVLNPDVTVRTRGVMEKCSFCVQKIQTGKLNAKKAMRPVEDGDVTSACSDACPSNAISFGDWNDTNSKIRKSTEDKRAYQALEEIGVKPNVWYKVRVRNEENEELAEIQSGHHGGGHHEEGEHGGSHEEEHADHGDHGGEGHDNHGEH